MLRSRSISACFRFSSNQSRIRESWNSNSRGLGFPSLEEAAASRSALTKLGHNRAEASLPTSLQHSSNKSSAHPRPTNIPHQASWADMPPFAALYRKAMMVNAGQDSDGKSTSFTHSTRTRQKFLKAGDNSSSSSFGASSSSQQGASGNSVAHPGNNHLGTPSTTASGNRLHDQQAHTQANRSSLDTVGRVQGLVRPQSSDMSRCCITCLSRRVEF